MIATVSGTDVHLTSSWPVRRPRPYRRRIDAASPLLTGQRVIDVLFPVVKGGSSAVPGGFGTGKTLLLQQITKWCDADVIVYVGCGERGNELADMLGELAGLSDPRTGGGDMTEPVTTYTQRFVRSLWSLDRDLAYARHYPAVSWSGSFSRDVDVVAAWQAGAGIPAGPTARAGSPRCSPRRIGSARWLSSWAPPPCRPGSGPRSWRDG